MKPHQPAPLSAAALLHFNANALKRMARAWVGKEATKMNKDACAQAIAQALADPQAMRAMVERLSPFEQAGLGLLKLHGHIAPTDVLALELLMLGLPFQERTPGYRYYHQESHYEALNSLLNKGLVWLWAHDARYAYHSDPAIDQYHYSPMLFADQRLLEHIAVVPPAGLDIAPVASVAPQWFTQPGEVVLRFVSFAEALRKLGRIEYTRQGRPSKPFLARLTRALGWETTLARDALTPLPDAALFFLQLFAAAGFLRPLPNEATLGIEPDASALFELPYTEQARVWVRAYRSLSGWIEHIPSAVRIYGEDSAALRKFRGLRAALLLALGSLPEPTAWYRISDLADGLYRRLGERFTLGYFHSFYPPFGASPEQARQKHREWQDKLQTNWRQNEQQWMVHAITGPLFHLGLVELAAEPDGKGTQPALFRLSALGRAAAYDIFRAVPASNEAAAMERRAAEARRCWVVQPNFDVIVYLDRASATRLTFIERVAERQPSQGATTLYHLTREAVYAALEAGTEPRTLIETLARGAEHPLPENVQRTLEDWAARRERLTVYPQVNIVEFADAQTRDATLAGKRVQGVLVGDRFVMLSSPGGRGKMLLHLRRTIDYHQSPARCVRIAEDGTVQLHRPLADLLVQGEMACWAESEAADRSRWRLTRASIQRAVNAGWTVERIIDSLSKRAQHGIPPLVSVAIRAWAGAHALPTTAALASELILQILSDEVATALASSALLQPYLRGRLGPRTFLVRPETAAELDRKLQEYGLSVGSDLLFAGSAQEG
jgi:hypothetical protein